MVLLMDGCTGTRAIFWSPASAQLFERPKFAAPSQRFSKKLLFLHRSATARPLFFKHIRNHDNDSSIILKPSRHFGASKFSRTSNCFSSIPGRIEHEERAAKNDSYFMKTYGLTQEAARKWTDELPYVYSAQEIVRLHGILDCFKEYGFTLPQMFAVFPYDSDYLSEWQDWDFSSKMDLLKSLGASPSNVVEFVLRFPECFEFFELPCFESEIETETYVNLFYFLEMLGLRDSDVTDPGLLIAIDESNELRPDWNKKTWEKKCNCLRKLGWTDTDLVKAFLDSPDFMATCVKEMEQIMDAILKTPGYKLSRRYEILDTLMYSARRVVPRCLIVHILCERGLIKRADCRLKDVADHEEDKFLEKFVTKYEPLLPGLKFLYVECRDSIPERPEHPYAWFEMFQNHQGMEDQKVDTKIISFLVESLGFTPEAAKLYGGVKINMVDAVINCFKQYGFTATQITAIVQNDPSCLHHNADLTIKPKLQLFLSLGASPSNISELVLRFPSCFKKLTWRSLPIFSENLGPWVYFLEMLGLRDSRGSFRPQYCAANVSVLRKIGMPECLIAHFFKFRCDGLCIFPTAFEERVKTAKGEGNGNDQRTFAFVDAVWPSKEKWEERCNTLRNWGWTDTDLVEAFFGNSRYISCSVEKMDQIMETLIKTFGYKPSDIVEFPDVFEYDMKRIVSRCCVVKLLCEKGLMKLDDYSVSYLLGDSEDEFRRKFVTNTLHKQIIPNLHDLYPKSTEEGIRFC